MNKLQDTIAVREPAPLILSASSAVLARDLVTPCPAIQGDASGTLLQEFLKTYPDLAVVPVLNRYVPMGLIRRDEFESALSRHSSSVSVPHASCRQWVSPESLVVDEETTAEELVRLASQPGCSAVRDGFLVTSAGHYRGICTADRLARLRLELDLSTADQELDFLAFVGPQLEQMRTASRAAVSQRLPDLELLTEPAHHAQGDDFFACTLGRGTLVVLLSCTKGGRPCAVSRAAVMFWLMARACSLQASAGEAQPAAWLGALDEHLRSSEWGRVQAMAGEPHTAATVRATVLWLPAARSEIKVACAGSTVMLSTSGARGSQARVPRSRALGLVPGAGPNTWQQETFSLTRPTRLLVCTQDLADDAAGSPTGSGITAPFLLGFLKSQGKRSVRVAMQALRAWLQTHGASAGPARGTLTMLCFTASAQPSEPGHT